MNPDYVISPTDRISLAVNGSDARFPVNRLFCIGRNYAAHAVEMGHNPDAEPPFFFMKPASAVTTNGFYDLPADKGDTHHEVEMIVAIAKGGRNIPVEAALDHIYGYGVGLDMTLRDVQAEAKKLGRPWDMAKAFDGSAPCGALTPASVTGHPVKAEISLTINGEPRQHGNIDQIIMKVPEIIAMISRSFALLPGDIIMTGTPAGVGPLRAGDKLVGKVENVGEINVTVR